MRTSVTANDELMSFCDSLLWMQVSLSGDQTVRKTRPVWFVEMRHVLHRVQHLTFAECMVVFEFFISLRLSPWAVIAVSTAKDRVKGFLATSAHNRASQLTLNCLYSKIKKFIDFPTFSLELTCARRKLKCLWTRVCMLCSNPPRRLSCASTVI